MLHLSEYLPSEDLTVMVAVPKIVSNFCLKETALLTPKLLLPMVTVALCVFNLGL